MLMLIPLMLSAILKVEPKNISKVVIKFELENYEIYRENGFSHLNFEDFGWQEKIGQPELPFKDICIGIPPGGNIDVVITSIQTETIKLKSLLAPVPKIVPSKKTFQYVYKIDKALYLDQKKQFIQIRDKEKFRFNNFIPVRFFPVTYDYNENSITICKKIEFEIHITGNLNYHNYIIEKHEKSIAKLIVNYDQAKLWKEKNQIDFTRMPFANSEFWYKFTTPKFGWHEITYQDLQLLPEFWQPSQLRLFTMDKKKVNNKSKFEIIEIPLFIDVKDENTFAKGDHLYFNIEQTGRLKGFDLNNSVYWLTFGGNFQNEPQRTEDAPQRSIYQAIQNLQQKNVSPNIVTRPEVDGVIIYPGNISDTQTNVFENYPEEYAQLHSDLNFIFKSQSDIFDEFSGGVPDQQAVENYLELVLYGDGSPAYPGQPEMQYVVLLGSGITNWMPQHEKNKIIVAMVPNSVASDDEFVDFNDDNRPELIIGRIPAKNNEMMEIYFQRLAEYINYPNPGFWRNEVLMMADDEHKGDSLEGLSLTSGLNHTARAQEAEDFVNGSVFVDKVLGIEYGFDEYQNKPAARIAQMNKINRGKLIWYFIGHGNEDVMGDEDYFRASLHMNMLDNLEKLPLYLAASCEIGKFDNSEIDCIAEKFLFHDGGGSIANIAATAKCSGGANTLLMKYVLQNILDDRLNVGNALLDAKLNSSAGLINSQFFNILGDPILDILPPINNENIIGISDSLQARETVSYQGDLENPINKIGETRVFEAKYDMFYENTLVTPTQTYDYDVNYTRNGNKFYFGNIGINNGLYDAQFIVPDDVHTGDTGRILNYVYDDLTYKDYLNSRIQIRLSGIPINAPSSGSPDVQLWIDSQSFVIGDFVSTDPTLIAHIEDENGVNILGSSGHSIFAIIDGSITPIDVTEGFIYNVGSATSGELTWKFYDLAEGNHSLQLIVFDNYNNPTVAETNFVSKNSGTVTITKMLPYPNPMKNGGFFTFVITEESDITITVYTLTGRKIKTLKQINSSAGYNQIAWDGKDADGDNIANNTYFYKITAKQLSNKKITEKIGKVIILK